jgi:hypothetical protein
VVDVGDPVGQADDLPLQRRGRARSAVVEDAVADRLVQVQPRALALEDLDDPQRMLVVAEARPEALPQACVEHVLPDVPEGRVAEVVAERDRLRQVLVEVQPAGDVARDDGRLERVGQARAVVVALGGDEDLGLVLEPSERLRVDDPVAVALERRPQGALLLGPRAPRRVGTGRERREHGLLALARTLVEHGLCIAGP